MATIMTCINEISAPVLHRDNVAAADAGNPADDSDAIDCDGYSAVRLDCNLTGTSPTATIQEIYWNSTLSAWCEDSECNLIGTKGHAVFIKPYGGKMYIKITALGGTSPHLTIYVSKVK